TMFGPIVAWEGYDVQGITDDLEEQIFDDQMSPLLGAFGRPLVNDAGSQRSSPGHCLVVGGPPLDIPLQAPVTFSEDREQPGDFVYRMASNTGERLFVAWADD